MNEFNAKSGLEDTLPTIKTYEGFGDLVSGRGKEGYVMFVAICMLDHPLVNQYLLDNNVKFSDRITKTQIFPREGMALPGGVVYSAPAKNEETK
jgi:hypothetical protein